MSKVYLIGAGPGDASLLTLKAKSIIEKADVVVYDRLVSLDILSMCNEKAKMVDVGKMPTHHKVKQSEINKLLVNFANEYADGTIARLKGGDPFVFGRGGEEALELVQAGVPFEVVPGITAGIAVPSYCGIPVTHRGLATSLHIITGHEREDGTETLGIDFESLARMNGTLVFYMGIASMPLIADKLVSCGKDTETPVAFIEKGTTPYERIVYATLKTAAEVIQCEKIVAPAITIMGDVVELGKTLSWRKPLPLSQKKLVVTRSSKQSSGIASRLRLLGAQVVETPMIQTHAVAQEPLWELFEKYDTVAFTSANGVEHFFELLKKHKKDARVLYDKKIASVGKVTSKKLLEYGLMSDFEPDDHTGEGLANLLCTNKANVGRGVLLIQGNLADDTVPNILSANDVKVERMVIYETVPTESLPDWKVSALKDADGILFASSSAVDAFVSVAKASGISVRDLSVAVCIGRVTEKTAVEYGFKTETSKQSTMDSLVEKVISIFNT
ncbi:MAG: uroporphyrinogen-III C-methyltransferase [Fibrobacter sp.]|nr:uroporphyrinogen-III C-methyltransferase [Fibrobacter sp.]